MEVSFSSSNFLALLWCSVTIVAQQMKQVLYVLMQLYLLRAMAKQTLIITSVT